MPSVELGARYDGGDAETGLGAELGGGLRYTHPGWGLDVAAKGRYLLVHEDAAFEQWSASLTARLQPPDGSGEGLSFALAPAWGSTASGVEALWGSEAGGLTNRVGQRTTAPGLVPDRVDVAVGYGVGLWDGRGLVTPFGEWGLTESGARRLRVGTRLAMRDTGLAVAVFGERRAQADAQQEYLVGFTSSWQF